MKIFQLKYLCLVFLLIAGPLTADETRHPLSYAPAAVENPLKGLVPYAGEGKNRFPHTLEFDYLPFAALVKGYDQFDWQPLEQLLDGIAGRGHQAVFRIYLEYPGRKDGIPPFLVKDGLKVHKYLNTNTQPEPPAEIETPDYENANLRKVLKSFIAAFGTKYDNDARIGYITAGLLGTWGEWHTYPKEELFASKAVQAEVMDAYQTAFKTTPVLLRYPAGKSSGSNAPNADRPFGYHDDSFAWATLHTGKADDDWYYMTALSKAGPAALAKWKTQPIGGEIRPEAWGHVFDAKPKEPRVQDIRKCVEETHASWLMDSGMFKKKQSTIRISRANELVRQMGYEFHIPAVTTEWKAEKLSLKIELENRGVAPIYYDWPVELGVIVAGKLVKSESAKGKLIGLLPGAAVRIWPEELSNLPKGKMTIALRVLNRLPKGVPIRFANKTQDQSLPGWLNLVEIER